MKTALNSIFGGFVALVGLTSSLYLATYFGAALFLRAQTLTVTIKPATPFTVSWDQPVEAAVPSFRLWCDNAIVKNYGATEVTKAAAPNADGTVTYTAQAPGLPAGNHSCLVSAFNDVGESKGTAIPIVVGTAPATPLRLKVIVSVGGGQ